MKKRENHLTSQRLSHFVDKPYTKKKKKGKEETINVIKETKEESA